MNKAKKVIAYGILAITWVTKRSWWLNIDNWARETTGRKVDNTENTSSS